MIRKSIKFELTHELLFSVHEITKGWNKWKVVKQKKRMLVPNKTFSINIHPARWYRV